MSAIVLVEKRAQAFEIENTGPTEAVRAQFGPSVIVAATLAAVASGNVAATARFLSAIIDGSLSYSTVAERRRAVERIVTAMQTFHRDATLVAACIGAITHASLLCTVAVPVRMLLSAVKPHELDPKPCVFSIIATTPFGPLQRIVARRL